MNVKKEKKKILRCAGLRKMNKTPCSEIEELHVVCSIVRRVVATITQ